jgi:hypothetical protein
MRVESVRLVEYVEHWRSLIGHYYVGFCATQDGEYIRVCCRDKLHAKALADALSGEPQCESCADSESRERASTEQALGLGYDHS